MAAIDDYLVQVQADFVSGIATEHTYRPALKTLLEALGDEVVATNEPRRVEVGAPDFVLTKTTGSGPLTIGHCEAKDVGIPLGPTQESEQLLRYRHGLTNLVLTDYLEFRWYLNGDLVSSARLGDLDAGRIVSSPAGRSAVETLLQDFARREPTPITSARELAERLARLTHIIRDMILETLKLGRASELISGLREALKQVLLPDVTNEEFADMLAQTFAYGLFAARVNHFGPNPFTRGDAGREIPRANPFLRRLFGALTGPDLDAEPFAAFVNELVQLLAVANMDAVLADFGNRNEREDPIVHFYETFLQTYDPRQRELRGVYFTPEPVVNWIVKAVDSVLKNQFGLEEGLRDSSTIETRTAAGADPRHLPRVLILDPALGTGSFLYSVVDQIRQSFMDGNDAGLWQPFVRDQLLPRLFGFELLMAPYAVAHLKMALQLAGQDLPEAVRQDWRYDFTGDERLGLFLTNTLDEAERASPLLLGQFISEEANAAAEIKRSLPIMVVLGNPPYSGHSANASTRLQRVHRRGREVWSREPTWIGQLVADYYEVDGLPLEESNTKWLQDDYVKFIRFGEWKIDASGAGVLAFITNNGYIDNPTFRGMRQHLLRTFDQIYVLNLHGSLKKVERTPSGERDGNVFDIQQGVAISVFVRTPDGDHHRGAVVRYADLWGSQASKYAQLSEADLDAIPWIDVAPRPRLYLFKPQDTDLAEEHEEGWRLPDVMPANSLGILTKRDKLAVGFDPGALIARLAIFADPSVSAATTARDFGLPLTDKDGWDLAAVKRHLELGVDPALVETVSYRPFDDRFYYRDGELVARLNRRVLGHLHDDNVALLVGRQGGAVGSEMWDAVWRTTKPSDQNVFRRGGSTVFPLYLDVDEDTIEGALATGTRQVNFSQAFMNAFAGRTGLNWTDGDGDLTSSIGPKDVFDYVYGHLFSTSYRLRYAEQLSSDFPRIQVTSDLDALRQLVAGGRRLGELHTNVDALAIPPDVSYPVAGTNTIDHVDFVGEGDLVPNGSDDVLETGRVYISQDRRRPAPRHGQYFDGVPIDSWSFIVGGHQVLRKWLYDRRRTSLDLADIVHYKKMVSAVRSSVEVIDEMEEALPPWPLPT